MSKQKNWQRYRLSLGLLLVIPCSWAADYLLPKEQYGKVNLSLNQSLISRQESNISGNGNYEPLALSPPQDKLRILARPVGRLDILYSKGTSTCTATLLSNEYALTNHHCISDNEKYGKVEQLSILMGYYSQLAPSQSQRFEVSLVPVASDKELDFALLRVSGNPANTWGAIKMLNRDPYPGESLMLIHHPLGLPLHVTRGRCRAAQPKSVSGTDIFHTCDTEAGSSGSPILTTDGTSMLGIHFSGVFGREAYNRGKRLTEIVGNFELIQQLAAITQPGLPPPINLPPNVNTAPQAKKIELPLSAQHGKETVFLKSSFKSIQEMDEAGCNAIKEILRKQAEQACIAKNATLSQIDYQGCDHTGRNVRRYSVKGAATCQGL